MGYIEDKHQDGVGKGYVRFNFYFRFKGERYRKKQICRRSAVQAIYRDWEDSVVNGQINKKQSKFFEIADKYLEYSQRKKPKLYNHEKKVIELAKLVFKNIPMDCIDPRKAKEFVEWREVHMLDKNGKIIEGKLISMATLNRNISTLSYFFNWSRKEGYYPHQNPFFGIKEAERNFREVTLTREEIGSLLAEASRISPMLYKVVMIALLSGMRRSNIFTLEWREVDLGRNRMILSEYKTKSGKAGVVPISPALKEILESLDRTGKYVITGYSKPQLRDQWDRLTDKLSFGRINDGTRLRFHDLRHLYAQSLLDSGLDIVDVQHMLHHSSSVITQSRYAQFARPDLVEKGQKIDNILPFKKVV